jgi:peptidoglycan/LPS O-acetylase OafA/YrhL
VYVRTKSVFAARVLLVPLVLATCYLFFLFFEKPTIARRARQV